MKKEEINETKLDLSCNKTKAKTSASSCWLMGIFFLGLKRKAHHPREATLVDKNNNIRVGADALESAQENRNVLQTKDEKQLQTNVGAILIARKNKMQTLHSGITLISLVITIIILLILAGVAISLTIGEDGIFKLASNSVEKYENSAEKEQYDLAQVNNNIGEYIIGGRQTNFIPDYSAKVDILSYNSESNQYTTPKDGYILIPSFASLSQNIYIYFDDFCVAHVGNSNGNWIRDYICLPISKDTKVYYSLTSTGNHLLDQGCWFIPSK